MPAGETEKNPSPWTIDSLHQHLNEAIAAVKEWVLERFHANEKAVEVALTAHEKMLEEIDRRYEQRFVAQEQAVQLALARVDKEFHEHIGQVRTETEAALDAADKAIQKQERETESRISKQEADIRDRFASVNEFRGTLSDQARALMPRSEAEQRIDQLGEKISALDTRLREDVSLINSRLDLNAGRTTGLDKGWAMLAGIAALAATVIGIVVAFGR